MASSPRTEDSEKEENSALAIIVAENRGQTPINSGQFAISRREITNWPELFGVWPRISFLVRMTVRELVYVQQIYGSKYSRGIYRCSGCRCSSGCRYIGLGTARCIANAIGGLQLSEGSL